MLRTLARLIVHAVNPGEDTVEDTPRSGPPLVVRLDRGTGLWNWTVTDDDDDLRAAGTGSTYLEALAKGQRVMAELTGTAPGSPARQLSA